MNRVHSQRYFGACAAPPAFTLLHCLRRWPRAPSRVQGGRRCPRLFLLDTWLFPQPVIWVIGRPHRCCGCCEVSRDLEMPPKARTRRPKSGDETLGNIFRENLLGCVEKIREEAGELPEVAHQCSRLVTLVGNPSGAPSSRSRGAAASPPKGRRSPSPKGKKPQKRVVSSCADKSPLQPPPDKRDRTNAPALDREKPRNKA